jgi:hypothetical protein
VIEPSEKSKKLILIALDLLWVKTVLSLETLTSEESTDLFKVTSLCEDISAILNGGEG